MYINDLLLFAVQITVKPVLSDHARATKKWPFVSEYKWSQGQVSLYQGFGLARP